MANAESNRRLLDMLIGWSTQTQPEYGRPNGEPEHQIVNDLYQEAGQIEEGDGEGIANFIFNRIVYLVLDGEPRYSIRLPKDPSNAE